MRKQAIRFVVGLAALATLGLACSSDDDGDSTDTTEESDDTEAPDATDAPEETDAPADSGSENEFVIQGFEFPEGFVGAAGEAITVRNEDGTTHTVTSADFSVRVSGGSSESLTVDAPGEYPIVCEIHSAMTGTITIE